MTEETQTATEPKTLGLERWVQLAFLLLAIATFFVSDKLIKYVWGFFAQPETAVASGAAVIVALLVGYFAYRHPKLNPLAHEVAFELSKVTWPSRHETWSSTLVVILTSIIAAAFLGGFDALWSAFTDLIYSTS